MMLWWEQLTIKATVKFIGFLVNLVNDIYSFSEVIVVLLKIKAFSLGWS